MHLIWNFLFCLPIHWWWKWFELQYWVNITTKYAPNSNWESVKEQTLCQIKPLEIQIAQHHFNSKTVYKKQRTAGGMPHPKPTDLDMTKHWDYFVWKDTSERVARRCDYTVDTKRVGSCVLKHLFLEGVEQPKISPKTPRNALSNAQLITRFQIFVFKKTALCEVLIYQLIRINSGPKILRSCFLHWHSCTLSHVFPLNTGILFLLLKPCHLVTGLFEMLWAVSHVSLTYFTTYLPVKAQQSWQIR